jgi:CRISPR/Cas system CSM-associated protein Csm3 (group 7 of RAMP superfamily)
VVEDAVIENSDSVTVEIRDGVGIDRQWGAAAEHIKYDRAILPRGTQMRFNLTLGVENREKRAAALAMIAVLRESLEQGQVRLGAAKTPGLGRIRLEGADLSEQTFGIRRGILDILCQRDRAVVAGGDLEAARKAYPTRPHPRLDIVIDWKPAGQLMVKAGFDGLAVDMLPLTSGIGGQIALVLPGSSIKGAFRSQAERIVRTLLGIFTPPWLEETNTKRKFLDAVELPLIDEIFGKRGRPNPDAPNEALLPGLGALSASDCHAQHHLTQQQWQAIQLAQSDGELRVALDAAGLQLWAETYHIAIDRWTGAAADGMLYSVLEPHRTEWEPIVFEVDLERLPKEEGVPAVALLLLVLRDLAQQRLPLGFGTHRGIGAAKIQSVRLTSHQVESPLDVMQEVSLPRGEITELPSGLRTRLNAEWTAWIARSRQEATT